MTRTNSSNTSVSHSSRSAARGSGVFRFIAPVAAMAALLSMPLSAAPDDPKPSTPPATQPPPAAQPGNPATSTGATAPPTRTPPTRTPPKAPGRDGNGDATAPSRNAPPTPISPTAPTRQRQLPANQNPASVQPTDARTLSTSAFAPADPNAAKVLQFDPEVLDFGEMLGGVSATLTYKITNISDQPITITKAIPSCGCTIPVWPKDPIPPGGFAEGQISLKPPEKQGIPLHKKVTFQLDGHSPIVYELKGHVVEVISVKPDFIEGPKPDQLDSASGEVVLTAVDGTTAFKVASVNPPIVKNLSEDAAVEHKLEIDWAKWADQGRNAKLSIVTDHPKAPTLMVVIKRNIQDIQPVPPRPGTIDRTQAADPLVSAVRQKDAKAVALLCAGGADPNKKDPVGGDRAPMHWAAKEGNQEIMAVLLEHKGNLEVTDRVGKTPLSVAAESKDGAGMVGFLLEKGANVNARDFIGGSPVLWAAGLGSPESVKLLIEKGADVNVVDVNGLTPLLWAAGIGVPETVDALLKAGAKTDVADKISGDTALMRAARTGRVESVDLLVKAGAPLDARNASGQSAFMLAATSGNVAKLEALKAAGADVKATDSRGWNAMDFAKNRIDNERTAVVAYLEGFLVANASTSTSPTATPTGGATGGTASAGGGGATGNSASHPTTSTEPAHQPTVGR